MSRRRKKLARLNEEFDSILALDRLYSSRTDLTEDDHRSYRARQKRRAEILEEIKILMTKKGSVHE
jgi:hypothetical protein